MNLQSIIDKRKEAAEYMVSEITHICKSFEKRDPGSKGEHQACEYMADVLKNECGCERADVEPFKENPAHSTDGFISPSHSSSRQLPFRSFILSSR